MRLQQSYVCETKRIIGERIKLFPAKIVNNLSPVAEHHKMTGHELDLDNIKVLCKEDKLLPRKVRYIHKEGDQHRSQ